MTLPPFDIVFYKKPKYQKGYEDFAHISGIFRPIDNNWSYIRELIMNTLTVKQMKNEGVKYAISDSINELHWNELDKLETNSPMIGYAHQGQYKLYILAKSIRPINTESHFSTDHHTWHALLDITNLLDRRLPH